MKKLNKKSLIFREIIDENNPNNKKLLVLLTRALIRYSIRFFKLNFGIFILNTYLFFIKKIKLNNFFYIKYLLKINIFRVECKLLISNNEISKYIKKRSDWAKFIIAYSNCKKEKKSALLYLDTISFFYNDKKLKKFSSDILNYNMNKKEKNTLLYLFGPNSKSAPNLKYKNSIIILTKMINFDVSKFQGSILFLNNYTSKNLTLEEKENLSKKYNEIFLSYSKDIVSPPFRKFRSINGGNIAGPMALARILFFLGKKYPRSEFVIEGFDFYLANKPYSGRVRSALPLEIPQLTESLICKSLSEHDFLFNFLYVKKLLINYTIKDSKNFLKVINMNSNQYLKKLFSVRDFENLSS